MTLLVRDLTKLPKAHLHLHFTGSMSVENLIMLSELAGIKMPLKLIDEIALQVSPDKRGWYRFQRLYDTARRVVNSEDAIRAVVMYAARDDAADGSKRLELQVDPSTYARYVGGLESAIEIIRSAALDATKATGVQVGLIIAASRMRHPLEARTLARLAVRNSGTGPGEVIGFGLSNDERAGDTSEWEGAFRIARKAGLAAFPHGGELRGPAHIRSIIKWLQPTRIGHGVMAYQDPHLLDYLANQKIPLEICPMSNVSLGIFPEPSQVPLRQIFDAGVQIALSADDPLLFLTRLSDQYQLARDLGFSDPELAQLAKQSIDSCLASTADKQVWKAEVDHWLASEPDVAKQVLNPAAQFPEKEILVEMINKARLANQPK